MGLPLLDNYFETDAHQNCANDTYALCYVALIAAEISNQCLKAVL